MAGFISGIFGGIVLTILAIVFAGAIGTLFGGPIGAFLGGVIGLFVGLLVIIVSVFGAILSATGGLIGGAITK